MKWIIAIIFALIVWGVDSSTLNIVAGFIAGYAIGEYAVRTWSARKNNQQTAFMR